MALSSMERVSAEIRLTRRRTAETSEYERIFNARLGFNQPQAELVFATETLSTPIFLANPILLDALDRIAQKMVASFANATTWAGLTGEAITKSLLQGDVPRLSSVAKALAISPRHLQNKLQKVFSIMLLGAGQGLLPARTRR